MKSRELVMVLCLLTSIALNILLIGVLVQEPTITKPTLNDYYEVSKKIDALLVEQGFAVQQGNLADTVNWPRCHPIEANMTNWREPALLFALTIKNFKVPVVCKFFVWNGNYITFIWGAVYENRFLMGADYELAFALTLSGTL